MGDATVPVQLQARVTGWVQGVGFRWWVGRQAAALGLTGRAVNRDDGDVDVVVEGPRDGCERLLEALHGSTPGRVRSVTSRWSTAQGLSGFSYF